MSTSVQAGVWACGPEEQGPAFVLLAIAENADDFGFAFPAVETIAQKARCDKRTAQRHLERLEQEDWLRVRRKVVNGRGNLYWINLEKIGVSLSPMAKQSPMITRILRLSGDNTPPIFWSKKTGDTEADSGDILANSGDTGVTCQVTKTADSGDKACHPNRKEPSLNRHTEPSERERSKADHGGRIWSAVKAKLEPKLNREIFRTWFHPLREARFDRAELFVRIPAPQFTNLGDRYGPLIAQALAETRLVIARVSFVEQF